MKKILITTLVILLLLVAGCASSSDLPATDTSKTLIELSDYELSQAIERNYHLMMLRVTNPGITSTALKIIVFQNEQLRRIMGDE